MAGNKIDSKMDKKTGNIGKKFPGGINPIAVHAEGGHLERQDKVGGVAGNKGKISGIKKNLGK